MYFTHRFLLSLLITAFNFHSFCQVTIKQYDDKYLLSVNNEPFEIKGVTFGFQDQPSKYDKHLEELRSMGVNTIRLWATDEHTETLLDVAETYGIKVMVGMWMRHGRPGMEADDRFDYLTDESGKDEMYDHAIEVVERYKDHPAVLTWGVGNEVYLNTATDEEKIAYSQLLEKVCAEIKRRDPNHPIISVEAWTFGLKWWEEYVPSIDIYGINCYGVAANLIQDDFEKRSIKKPYVITEFNVTGEWDASKDTNGVAIEPTDLEKYNAITVGYRDWINPKPSCLGVYFFHYADGDQFMAPWLFTHFLGKKRPAYYAIKAAYSEERITNPIPVIASFEVEGTHQSGNWVPVEISTADTPLDQYQLSFYYNQRTGSRKRRDQIKPLLHQRNEGVLEVQMPKEHGAIKIYATLTDSTENMGMATSSVQVIDEKRSKQPFLVPKPELPFYVYDEGDNQPYIPSAFMGNIPAIELNLKKTKEVKSGAYAIEISYKAKDNWYGVGFVDPPNDWGKILGGYDLSGATSLSFWAKSSIDGIKAQIGFGLIDSDKQYYDTSKKLVDVELTTEWTQYRIKTKKLDLSCIRSGFVIFSSGNIVSHRIYLDNIVFE